MAAALGVVALGLALALRAWPPALIRIGAAYTAKIVCSNVFLAGRDPEEVLWTDVQAPGHPLLRLMRVAVDRHFGVVRAGLFGSIGHGLAVARPGAGCTVLPDGRLPDAVPHAATTQAVAARSGTADARSPGAAASPGDAVQDAPLPVSAALADDSLAGPGMRAIVVMSQGRRVAERYAHGFDAHTRQLGWSMTKTVTAGLIGLLVKDGRLGLQQSAGLEGGGRERVTVAELMSMTSGLRFNESYGAVSDVTRMLYLEPDMAAFAAAEPLLAPGGAVWSYSSGSAVIVARTFQRALGGNAAADNPLDFVRTRLFEPLGMTSAVIEADETGTLVGSSYMYATPRDWARFAQLLVQDGVWEGREILPRGYVGMMASPVLASAGEYGHGMVWRWVSERGAAAANGIPPDTFWMSGHDGQFIAIVPSRQTVILRMGLTPASQHYRPEPLVGAVLKGLP